jgi:hypothetical protein
MKGLPEYEDSLAIGRSSVQSLPPGLLLNGRSINLQPK